MALEFRNYKRIAEGNLEHIRNDIWDVEFLSWPSAVYNPGIDIIKTRLMSFDGGQDTQSELITKTINGHNVVSPGGRSGAPADCTFTFNDREDQSITYLCHDYNNQCGDPNNGFGRHKSELVFDFKLVFYNTLLVPVREIVYYDCIYSGSSISDAVGEHGGDNSSVTLTIHSQHHERFFL